ncbi:MAG: arsenate reductase family protein [Bacteriovoracaceae bacterium]
MPTLKLFGIPNCDTVKKARTFLEMKKIDYEFVDFKKTAPTADDIQRWEKVFGGIPVNKAGQTYKKHKETFEGLSPKEKIAFISANSSMIKRPILEKNGKVLTFGFDEDEYKSLLK